MPQLFHAFVAITSIIAVCAQQRNLLPSSPEDAWKDLESAAKPPALPEEWAGKAPNPEQRKQFEQLLGTRSAEAAEKAHEFYNRFPNHENAAAAKEQELRFVKQALNFGATNLSETLLRTVPEEERLKIRINSINRKAMALQPEGLAAVMKELEAGLRGLIGEHPKSTVPWSHLLIVAQNTNDRDHAKTLLEEIVNTSAADQETKNRAKGLLHKFGAVGRPIEMSFTTTDGTAIDLQKMKGKVVLLDFWASWCGPCIASLPDVIKLYDACHDKGLEIIGVNMDKSRPAMDAAIETYRIPWHQYFDGRGWGNRFALEYNVSAIPAMWLVDKKGILRTMEAREDLETKVKELLAE